MNRKSRSLGTLLLLAFLFLNVHAGLASLCDMKGDMQERCCCRPVTHAAENDSEIVPIVCGCEMAKGPAKIPPATMQTEGSYQAGHSGKWLSTLVYLTPCSKDNTPTYLSYCSSHSSPNSSEVKLYDLNSSYLI